MCSIKSVVGCQFGQQTSWFGLTTTTAAETKTTIITIIISCYSNGDNSPHCGRRTDRCVMFARWVSIHYTYMVPEVHTSCPANDFAVGSAVFMAHGRDHRTNRHTDRQRYSVCNNRLAAADNVTMETYYYGQQLIFIGRRGGFSSSTQFLH